MVKLFPCSRHLTRKPDHGCAGGLGAGGAVGGLVGALVSMGIPEYEAQRYEGRVKEGGILVSVYCDSSEDESYLNRLAKEVRKGLR
jgi:hypothetical protein